MSFRHAFRRPWVNQQQVALLDHLKDHGKAESWEKGDSLLDAWGTPYRVEAKRRTSETFTWTSSTGKRGPNAFVFRVTCAGPDKEFDARDLSVEH